MVGCLVPRPPGPTLSPALLFDHATNIIAINDHVVGASVRRSVSLSVCHAACRLLCLLILQMAHFGEVINVAVSTCRPNISVESSSRNASVPT